MNKQGYITQMLGYYEDVLENVFRTGYLYDPYGDDVLENYLFHVLTDAKIQARLDDERLQRVLKDELLAFFRYILEQRLQPKDMEQRMKLAAELLSRSNGSLTEIAAHCGFSDLVYFHQRFRMYFGCSPLCYRRQNKNGFSL